MLNKLAVVALITVASLAQAQARQIETRYSAEALQGYYEGRYSAQVPQGFFDTGREEMVHATGN
jgi:hypothetical protein